MLFEGNKEVLSRLFQKQKLLQDNNPLHQRIRPALLVCSGTMRGVYGGGGTIALEREGLTDIFDVAVGVSTGSPVLAYFLAGHVEQNLSVYWEECTTSNFFSWNRFVGGPIVDTDWLCKVFRGEVSCKGLRQEAVLSSRTAFYTATTCAETGKGVLLDAKQVAPDVVEAIRASIALPGLSRGEVTIGDKRYVDGAGALPFPAPKIINDFAPTDLLIFTNCSEKYRSRKGILEQLLSSFFFSGFSRPVQDAFASRSETAMRDIHITRNHERCRVAIVWSDEEVGQFQRDSKKLRAAAGRAQSHLTQLLQEAKAIV